MVLKLDVPKLQALMIHLNMSVFTETEWAFLQEYKTVMKPIANGLDMLQGNNIPFGKLLPVLFGIRAEIDRMISDHIFIHCSPLMWAVKDGFEKRFGPYMDINDLKSVPAFIACMSHPHYKLQNIPSDILTRDNIKKLANMLTNAAFDIEQNKKKHNESNIEIEIDENQLNESGGR